MAGKLPTVTAYIRNVGKSVSYKMGDQVKDISPNISNFLETNDDMFKTVYSATKNYKQTIKKIDRDFRRSNTYKTAKEILANAKEDLRTGNFVNREREEKMQMEAMGLDFDFDMDDIDFESSDDSSSSNHSVNSDYLQAKSTTILSAAISDGARSQNQAIMDQNELIVNTSIASTKAMNVQAERIFTGMLKGFNGVNAGIGLIASVMTGPITTYLEESTKFMTDTSNKLEEIRGYLKETTEMQRNLYKVQQEEYKSNRYDDVTAGGGVDLNAYAKNILKNYKELNPLAGMISDKGASNAMKMFLANPLAGLPGLVAKVLVPSAITQAFKSFDENLAGVFPTFIAKMNQWAEDDSGGLFNIKGIIGSLLGIKIDKKTRVDPSKYQRGPIPFDGETKKAIVDVIPAYLARIESAISGGPERIFDGRTGKFTTLNSVRQEYDSIKDRAARNSVSGIAGSFNEWQMDWINSKDLSAAEKKQMYKDLQKKFTALGKQIYDDGGQFEPYAGFGKSKKQNKYVRKTNSKGEVINPSGFNEDEWLSFMQYLNQHNKKGVYNLAGDTMEQMIYATKMMQGREGGFANPFAAMYDDRFQGVNKKGQRGGFDPATDKLIKNRSAIDYLRDILAEVRYIRIYGGSGGKGKKKGSKSSAKFNQFYNSQFSDEDIQNAAYEYVPNFEDGKKEKTQAEKYGITKENLKKWADAKGIGEKRKVIKGYFDELFAAPAKFAETIIRKADQRIYETLFGSPDDKKYRDKNGKEYTGFMQYLVGRASDMFDELKKKLQSTFKSLWDRFAQTKVGGWITKKGKDFVGAVGQNLRNKGRWLKNRGQDALDRTYGRLYQSLNAGHIVDASYASTMRRARQFGAGEAGSGMTAGEEGPIDLDQMTGLYRSLDRGYEPPQPTYDDFIGNAAFGGVVDRYGLAMLSPGEIVIPNPKMSTRRKNLAGEKREKARIFKALKGGKVAHHAYGLGRDDEEQPKVVKAIKTVMRQVDGQGADIAADALIGSGVSLITGLFGGPLLGAAAGAGIGLVKHSELLQNVLFGKVGKDGQRDGKGLIPKSVTDFFKKHSEGMIDFGMAGAVAGLFTPLGLVGGALAGATLGYAKDTKTFKDFMFGNEEEGKEGLIPKNFLEKFKDKMPKIGLGALGGLIAGPFGLVGNIMVGSAIGYASTTDKFQDAILGKKNDKGEREGGVVGALKAGLVEPLKKTAISIRDNVLNWFKKDVLNPAGHLAKSVGGLMKDAVVDIGYRISDGINGIFKKHFGIPLETFLREKVFKKISDIVGGVAKGALWLAKAPISLLFGGADRLATRIDNKRIARGTYGGVSRDRNAARDKFGPIARLKDKTKQLDYSMANASAEQLESQLNLTNTLIDNTGVKNKAFHAQLSKGGNAVSKVFDKHDLWNKIGHWWGFGSVNKTAVKVYQQIMKLAEKGDFDKLAKYLSDPKNGVAEYANEIIEALDKDKLLKAKADKDEEQLQAEVFRNELARITGNSAFKKKGHKGLMALRNYNKNLRNELADRKKNGEPAETGYEDSTKTRDKILTDNTTNIIDILDIINKNLLAIGTGEKSKLVSIENARAKRDGKAAKKIKSKAVKEQKDEQETVDVPAGDGLLMRVYKATGKAVSGLKQNAHVQKIIDKKNQLQEKMSNGIERMNGFFSGIFGKKDDNDGKKPNLLQRLLGSLGGGVGKILGVAGKGLKTGGLILGGILGISLLGYGSEFLKTKVWPWMKEKIGPVVHSAVEAFQKTKLYGAIEKFIGSIKDGSLFTMLAGKVAQGVGLALKNIAAPLAYGIVRAIPEVIKGLWGGITSFFGRHDKTVNFDATKTFTNYIKSIPSGNDESQIASIAGYSTSISFPSAGASATVKVDKNALGEGVTTETDEYGNTTYYSKDGKVLAESNGNGELTKGAQAENGMFSNIAHATKRGIMSGLATGKVSKVAKISGAVGRKLFNAQTIGKSVTGIATGKGIMGKAIHGAGALIKTAGAGITRGAELGAKVGAGITNGTLKSSLKTKLAEITAKATENSPGILKTVIKKISEFGTRLAQSEFVTKTLTKFMGNGTTGAAIADFIKKFFEGISKKLGTIGANLGAKLSKVTAKCALGVSPLTIAFWTASFIEGAMTKTETILGVSKDAGLELTVGGRAAVGLVHAINENLLLGLIPTSTLIDLLMNIDKEGNIFGFSKENLDDARNLTDQLITKAGLEAGDTVTLAEANGQQGFFSKIWSKLTGKNRSNEERNSSKNSKTDTSTSTKNNRRRSRSGRARDRVNEVMNDLTTSGYAYIGAGRRGGSQGGIYANMPYGNSTIGASGCGPVAAANLLGSGTNIPDAARYAQMTGHVTSNGATDIGFFNDYLNSKGVPNATTTKKSDVAKALRNGQSMVLLGQNANDNPYSTYSNNPHYITARGNRNGTVDVNDPELGYRRLNTGDVLNGMKASVITGRSRYYGGTRAAAEANAASRNNAEQVLKWARSQLNYHSSGYSKFNEAYGSAGPWCVMFVWWCFHQAGADSLFFGGNKSASSGQLLKYYRDNGQLVNDPKKGDIVFFHFPSSSHNPCHTAICSKDGYTNGKITTIDGNTSMKGSQDNGGWVNERTRDKSNVTAIARPLYAGVTIKPSEVTDVINSSYSSGSSSSSSSSTSSGYDIGADGVTENLNSDVGTLFDKITAIGKTMVKQIFGSKLYNFVFGADDESDDSGVGLSDLSSGLSASMYGTTSGTTTSNSSSVPTTTSSGESKPAASTGKTITDIKSAPTKVTTAAKGRGGYARNVNTKYSNYVGSGYDLDSIANKVMNVSTNTNTSSSMSTEQFFETIVNILMSISSNTEALNKILQILSSEFNISASTEEVQNATTSSREQAQKALKSLMSDRSSANQTANLLQKKNTNYLIEAMTNIARE